MKYTEFDKKVDKIKRLHPIWFKLMDEIPATEEQIHEAEDKLNVILPYEYKYILKRYGGGYFAFVILYSINSQNEYNLIKINMLNKLLFQEYVLFSENQLGDFYGFKIVDGKCLPRVYFYDHEIEVWSKTKYDNLFDYLAQVAFER